MYALTTRDPYVDNTFDELIRGFFRPVRVQKQPASLKMDVTENGDTYVIKAEIPGVTKEDIEVSIEGNRVTIGAEVKSEAATADSARVLRRERHQGNVCRSFTLPAELDEATSNAKYENGVLELTLTKKPAHSGRKLTIQ